jgi:hypothetical protein
MISTADPAAIAAMKITSAKPGDSGLPGQVILAGATRR